MVINMVVGLCIHRPLRQLFPSGGQPYNAGA